jgi:VIT1/CCC1 family predicted Fe2+/Mn2+ transporter
MFVPTIGYLAVCGFFIIVPALLSRRSFKGFIMSIIVLALHLLFLRANL